MDLLTPKFELFFDNDTNFDAKQYDNNDWNVGVIEQKGTKKKASKKRTVRAQRTTKTKAVVQKYKKKRQQCELCSTSYSKREYLKKHMLKEHNAELERKRPGKFCPFYVKSANDPR